MRRVLRMTRAGLFVLSLVLAMGAAVVWARSEAVGDDFEWLLMDPRTGVQRGYFLETGRGGIAVVSMLFTDGADVRGVRHFPVDNPVYAGRFDGRSPWRAPFDFEHVSTDPLEDTWVFAGPLWACLLAFLIGPILWAARKLRGRRRLARALCARCGYDLRASPARCPECGAAVRLT